MNRYLLAGCAAIALTFGSGAANAQAKFEVRIGGDAYFEAGYVSQDNDTGLRSTEMRNRFRLNIVPSAKTDNGLEYGGRLRLRANDGAGGVRTTDADRALLFVGGSFGRFELGTRNTWNDEMAAAFIRPIDFHFLGIYDPGVTWATTGNANAGTTKLDSMTFAYQPAATSTTQGGVISDVSTKITYISPKFAGFQAGGSYTPHSTSSNGEINRLQGPTGAGAGTLQDVWEANLYYSGSFGGVDVRAGGGYLAGAYEDSGAISHEDLSAVEIGGQIGYAGFILGGGYMWYGESGLSKTAAFKDDYEVWNVGLQYTTGPFILGVGYTHGSDAGDVRFAGNREQDFYTAGASYLLAPGLRVALEYNFINLEVHDTNATAATRDVDSHVFIARSVLTF